MRGPYKPGGSIAGFGQITFADDSVAGEATAVQDFSVGELVRSIRELQDLSDPETLWKIQNLIETHMLDKHNPHKLTLETVVTNVGLDLLGSVFPGEPISELPTLSILPELIDIYPFTVHRASPMYVTTASGRLKQIPAGKLSVDYTYTRPSLPLWPRTVTYTDIQNLVSYVTDTPSTYLKVDPTDIDAPDTTKDYVTFKTNSSVALYGFPTRRTIDDMVGSVFIYPLTSTGSLSLYFGSSVSNKVTLDLTSLTLAPPLSDKVHVRRYPSGWIRLSVCTTMTADTNDTLTLEYTGISGDICHIFGVCTHNGSWFGPYLTPLVNSGILEGTHLEIQTSDLFDPTVGMFHLKTTLNKSHTTHPILSVGDLLSISVGGMQVTTTIHPTAETPVSFIETEIPVENTFIVSYSASSVTQSISGGKRVVKTGAYPTRTVDTTQVGPFPGSILQFSYYPVAETIGYSAYLLGEQIDV